MSQNPQNLPAAVWILSPRHARRFLRRAPPVPWDWCYFGADVGARDRVAGVFHGADRVRLSADLTCTAEETKRPFLDWLVRVGETQGYGANWWSSPTASKSTLQTGLFLSVCQARMLERWLRDIPRLRRVVVVEDPWLLRTLEKRLGGDPCVAFFGTNRRRMLLDAVFRLLRGALVAGYAGLLFLWAILLCRLLFRRERPPNAGASSGVLLYSWVEPRCFRTEGFSDPYFGRLEDILTAAGLAVKRIMPIRLPTRLFLGLRKFSSRFLTTAHFLGPGDVLKAVATPFRLLGLRRLPRFDGWDCGSLLLRDALREWSHSRSAETRLFFPALKRMAERWGPFLKSVIYPFENLPWEKMLCLAFREEAPAVRLIGYQHGSMPPMLLCYDLGAREREVSPLPDEIVATGAPAVSALAGGGFPSDRLWNGGALRFESLSSPAPAAPRPRKEPDADRLVLVGFTTTRHESKALLGALLRRFPSPFLAGEPGPRLRFILQCHPDLPLRFIVGKRASLPEWFVSSEKCGKDYFREVDAVIYTPPTGVWLEARAAGIPVLKYLDDFLDNDWADSLGIRFPACTEESLPDALRRALSGEGAPEGAPSGGARIFSPVDESLWVRLAGGAR